jgi:transcriptional regulator with XRE-family HTH domain
MASRSLAAMTAVSAKPETSKSLRARRRELGISQQALAAAAACSLSSVRLFESGFDPEHSPTRERVESVLAELERRNGQRAGSAAAASGPVDGRTSVAAAGAALAESLPVERQVAGEEAR